MLPGTGAGQLERGPLGAVLTSGATDLSPGQDQLPPQRQVLRGVEGCRPRAGCGWVGTSASMPRPNRKVQEEGLPLANSGSGPHLA